MWARGPCLRGSHKSVRPWWSLHEGWPPAAAKTMPPFVRWRLATAMEMETSRGELRSRMWMPEASLYLSTLYLSTYVPMYRWGTTEVLNISKRRWSVHPNFLCSYRLYSI